MDNVDVGIVSALMLASLRSAPTGDEDEFKRSRTGQPGIIGAWREPQKLNANGSLHEHEAGK